MSNDNMNMWYFREAVKYIQEHLAISVDELGKDSVVGIARTAMSSKVIGP